MLRSALEVMQEAICLCDEAGAVFYINSAAKELTGWQEGPALDRCCRQILDNMGSINHESCQIDLNQTASGNIELNGKLLNYSISPMQDEGQPCGFLIIMKSTPDTARKEEKSSPQLLMRRENAEDDIRKRDRILAGAALATNQLLITSDLDPALNQALEILGCSADVDRVYIFENYDTKSGDHCCKLRYDWFKESSRPERDNHISYSLFYSASISWYENLAGGMPLKGLTRDQPLQARALLEQQNVLSFLVVPIFTKDGFWGFIGFDDRKNERIWTWGEVSVSMTIAGAIGASLDRWQTQAALRESEKKYRELVESANSIIMRRDTAGNITFINKFAEDFFGYRREEIIGINVVGTIVSEVDSEGRDLRKMIENIGKNPEDYATNVNENTRSNGERVWIAWTNRPVRNDKGEIVEILCIGNDLTENKLSSEKLKKAVQDLRETRDYLESLFGHANAPIIVWDPSFKITRFNHAFERLTGHRAEDVLGLHLDILFPKASRAASLAYIEKTLSGEHWDAVEIPILRKDGQVRTVLWNSATIYDEEGKKVVATIAQGQDITENKLSSERLKKAVQDLRETRDYLESLFGHANAPIIVWDPSFKITRFNHAFERLTCHRAEDVLGLHLDILFPKASRTASLAYIEKTFSGEHWDAVEIPILRKDGEIRTVLWNSATIYDEEGKTVVATIAQGQDITERKEAESQVIFQASLLDQVRNAVIATDLEGKIVYWNHFAEVLYQWKADEVLGKSIVETIVPEGKGGLIKGVIEDIIHYGYRESEHMVRRKDGSQFPAFYVFNALKDRKGQSMGFVSVSIDLTDRKTVEQDLRLAKERAELATKAKSEFLANMSHEIRTPMNAVIGLTGLLLNTNIDSEQRDYIETIRSSGDSLLAVISDILDFSKIEGGMLELEKEPFDLQKCLEASVNLVAQAAARKGLFLRYSIEPDVPRRLLGDLTRLKQILVNLLGNAVKFTEAGEIFVRVSSQPKDGKYEICFGVKDTGIGISKDRMSRLFQSFSQVDASTTRKYGGTGLGLAISKNLAELMGGRIWAESEPGMGSVFYFTILAETSPEPSPEEPHEGALQLPIGLDHEAKKQLFILLAEDNAINQKVAIRMLERLGYKADIAANGCQVLGALQSHPYDVVLMDVQMPEMDGLEATRRIRLMPGRQPYIIAMTAHAMKGDREECLEAGMNDYVSKPVRIEELQIAIERSLPVGKDEKRKAGCKP